MFSSTSWCARHLVFLLSFLPILVKQSSSLRASSSSGDSSDSKSGGDDGQELLPESTSRLLVGRTLHERQQELEVLTGIKVGTSVLTTVVDDSTDDEKRDNRGSQNGGGRSNTKKLRCKDGREYPLEDLKPYTELFSSENFAISDDGTHVTNIRDGETFKIPVSRATYYHEDDEENSGENGGVTVLQTFSTENEDGEGEKLEFAEIRGSSSGTFFVNANSVNGADDSTTGNAGSSSGETLLLSFDLNDIDISMLRENYHYGEGEEPPITEEEEEEDKKKKKGKKKGGDGRDKDNENEEDEDKEKKKGKKKGKKRGGGGRHDDGNEDASDTRQLLPNFVYNRGDGTSAECTYFKVVNIAIAYDSDFCQRYGSFAGARNRIIAIVASASLYYERDMCVKLRLTDIYTPDASTCRAPSPTFRSFARGTLCGSTLPHMLYDFSRWMARMRRSLNINSKSLVHLMTGSSPPSGTLGCAWLGTFCWDSFSYGVEHMNYSGSNIVTQSLILAHEVGHNLNAPHFESNSREYVMESRLSRGTDGFSLTSARRIVSFLDTKTCDDVLLPPTPAPKSNDKPPTKKPTPRPTKKPTDTSNGCVDENGSSEACVFKGKNGAYACLGATDILESRFGPGGGGCLQSRSANFVLESCNGIPLKLSSPSLGGGPVAEEDQLSNDGVGDGDSNDNIEDEFSNDNPASEEKKKGGVCNRSCYFVGGNVCLSAAKVSMHSIEFSTRNSQGAMERFETAISVMKNGDGCYEASTKCK